MIREDHSKLFIKAANTFADEDTLAGLMSPLSGYSSGEDAFSLELRRSEQQAKLRARVSFDDI